MPRRRPDLATRRCGDSGIPIADTIRSPARGSFSSRIESARSAGCCPFASRRCAPNVEGQRQVAGLLRLPHDRVRRTAHRGQADVLRDFVSLRREQLIGHDAIARQRTLDRERHAHGLARSGKRRHVEAEQLQVRQPRRGRPVRRTPARLSKRSCVAAWTGGGPSFQSPSETKTIPARFLTVPGALASGSCNFCTPASVAQIGWMTTWNRSRARPRTPPRSARRSPRACVAGPRPVAALNTASRVCMLGEASHSTATAGFSCGRNSWMIPPIEHHRRQCDQRESQQLQQPEATRGSRSRQASKHNPAVAKTSRPTRPPTRESTGR